MNRCSTVLVVLAFLASLCLAPKLSATQTPASVQTAISPAGSPTSQVAANQPPAPSGDMAPLLKGTTLVAEFSHGLNAGKLKPGDKVKAVLTQDLLLKGKIVAPNDSKLIGHVTQVKKSTEADLESRLGVVFDKVILKHHKEFPLQAGVQALLAPVIRRSRVDEPDQMMPPPMVASSASSVSSGSRGANSSNTMSPNSGAATTSAASLNSMGTVATVRSTPVTGPGSQANTVDLAKINMSKLNASTGMRGVYGIKGIALGPPSNDGSVIISPKSNVKLDNGTQIILVVLR